MSVTQVQTSGITDDAVTNAKIANDAVGTDQITDDAVTNAKIANDAVGTDQITNGVVSASKLTGNQTGTAPIYGVRAYGRMINGETGSPSIAYGGNLESASKSGSSPNFEYRITFTTPMPNIFYSVSLTIGSDGDHVCQVTDRDQNFFKFTVNDPGSGNNVRTAISSVYIIVVG